ncbi:G-protein coupled receptor Mth2-like [Eriocheir sinensis]|uniref:G-protein coupled receptor Mth2-like n=1 Tax=Eriocheir sinensis TaxID=95602 RepID=UPI0021C96FB6|nr:G-protein coupled receptor Mth2-like [Eriocheir sinensis]
MKPRAGLLFSLLLLALLTGTGSDQSRDTGGIQQGLNGLEEEEAEQKEEQESFVDGGVAVYNGDGVDVNISSSNITVPLCCGVGMTFNMTMMKCEPAAYTAPVTFHYEDGRPVEYPFMYQIQVGFLKCPAYSLSPESNPDDAFLLLPEGILKLEKGGAQIGEGEFCLLATEGELHALVCFRHEDQREFNSVVYQTLYPVGLIISAIFLGATFIVYCLVMELRDLLGRCLMCGVLCLCIAQIWIVIIQMGSSQLPTNLCIAFGILMHFFYLAAFLWLNVICFNVFLTVCRKNLLQTGVSPSRWFLVYSCYAWGLSLLICSLAVARDFAENLQNSFLPKPNFEARCWFSGDDALIIFFYGPTSVILGVNVILFCVSAYKLFSLSKSSEARTFQFTMYLKLFVLMGVTWIFEVISFFVQRETYGSSTNYIWIVFDLINIMQGPIIFFVFVCRRAVLVRVCEVLCGVRVAKETFPGHYLNAETDTVNNETTIKHSVI